MFYQTLQQILQGVYFLDKILFLLFIERNLLLRLRFLENRKKCQNTKNYISDYHMNRNIRSFIRRYVNEWQNEKTDNCPLLRDAELVKYVELGE